MEKILQVKELLASNQNQAMRLYATGDRKRKLDAKLILKVNALLGQKAFENGIKTLIGNINHASAKSQTYNLGEQLESLTATIIDKKGSYAEWCETNTLGSLVNNTPNFIRDNRNYYIIVVKATTQGVFVIDSKTIIEKNLLGLRLTLTNVLEYGKKINSNVLGL